MPALANIKHERFAQAIFESMARQDGQAFQGRAYKAAGYNVTNSNSARACASRLLTFANGVAERIHELKAEAAKHHRVTIQTIVEELEEARAIAREEKQTATMVTATNSKAKLYGLSVDRVETGKPGDFSDSNSTREIVDSVLKQANPDLESVTDEQRLMAGEEMARHARALQAIAAGDPMPSSDRPQPARHAN